MSVPQVLVINDDTQQRDRIVHAIEGICDPIAPTSHAELVQALAAGAATYAVIILDYAFEFWSPQKPPMNGADVVALLRAQDRERPPVLLLTNFETLPEVRNLARTYNLPLAKVSNMSSHEIENAVAVFLRRAAADR